MLEIFLFNVIVGGIVLSAGGLIGLELLENFNRKYKMSEKRNTAKKSKLSEKYGHVKIARNSGKIDIRMSKTKNEVA
ncbi:MAG: hypothetical protein Q4D53_06715 [Leptotrichiaceae bacterium]|nr:hypothetical protein [Leptotrichiaceae bacterium]